MLRRLYNYSSRNLVRFLVWPSLINRRIGEVLDLPDLYTRATAIPNLLRPNSFHHRHRVHVCLVKFVILFFFEQLTLQKNCIVYDRFMIEDLFYTIWIVHSSPEINKFAGCYLFINISEWTGYVNSCSFYFNNFQWKLILNFDDVLKTTKGSLAKVRKLKLIHQKHPKEQQIVPPKLLSYLQPYNAVIFINYGKGCSVITMQRYFACIWSTTSGTRELTYSITPTVRSVCLTSVCLVCQSSRDLVETASRKHRYRKGVHWHTSESTLRMHLCTS